MGIVVLRDRHMNLLYMLLTQFSRVCDCRLAEKELNGVQNKSISVGLQSAHLIGAEGTLRGR